MSETLTSFAPSVAVLRPTNRARLIISAIADHFGITLAEIVGPSRDLPLVRPRQAAMWIIRRATPLSLPSIGRLFGGRDHSTVVSSIRRIDALMAKDAQFDAEMRALAFPFLPAVAA